ncbi:MAG: conserved hypothetical rane protein [Nocardioidaceae bacterium]|nr:conserved hypothetical rane protein [Nocardioidaceae bacterium]
MRTRLRLRDPLLVGAVVVVGAVAVHLRDPHDAGSWGSCPLRTLTGWDCPLCGGLRAVNDLTHAHVASAAASNLFLVVSLPVLVALWSLWLVRSWRHHRDPVRPRPLLPAGRASLLVGGYLALLVVFTVVRNTPAGHGLWA